MWKFKLLYDGSRQKKVSVSKGVLGAVFLGPIGLTAGLLGNKDGKFEFYCQECGTRFKVK